MKLKIKTKKRPARATPIIETIHREETKYGLEEYFQRLVASGEWELLPFCSAFEQRSAEGQVLILVEAIENRVTKLRRFLNDLARQKSHLAYIAILDQINNLEQLKTEALERHFSQYETGKLAEKAEGERFH